MDYHMDNQTNWNDLPRDIKGQIIGNLPLKNFGKLIRTNKEMCLLTLSHINPENESKGKWFCQNVYVFIFKFVNCLTKTETFNLFIMVKHLLMNKNISLYNLFQPMDQYSSKDDNCILIHIFNLLLKRIDASDLKEQNIGIILALNEKMIRQCMLHRSKPSFKIKPTLKRIKLISYYIEKWIKEKMCEEDTDENENNVACEDNSVYSQ